LAPAPAPVRAEDHRWTTPKALVLHGVIAIWVPGCALATWWQVNIALSGDNLGWIYTFMWPCFAVFAVVLWWNLIHDDPDTVGARGLRRLQEEAAQKEAAQKEAAMRDAGLVSGTGPEAESPAEDAITRAEAEDGELAAYNAYLAELRRTDSKNWRRR
jgi:hypothetical protein